MLCASCSMNSLYLPKQQIVERIIRNNAGQVYRAYFAVSEIGGKFHAKLISAEPISDASVPVKKSEKVCCLASGIEKIFFEIELQYSLYEKPVFARDFSFVFAQPTRAPSIVM